MLISDLELRYGVKKVQQFHHILKHVAQSQSEPALFRLQLRVPHASSFLSDGDPLHATLDIHDAEWKPVSKLDLNVQSTDDQPFDHQFTARDCRDIRIHLWYGPDLSKPQGHIVSNLRTIAMAAHERLQMTVAGLPRSRDTAELSLKWVTPEVEKLILNIRVQINNKQGWPFSNARPYFAIYCWENKTSSWEPMYRSEVMTKANVPPGSQRALKYLGAMIKMDGTKVDDNQARRFRLEFLHYKTMGSNKLLACYHFDLRQLRQVAHGQRLDLKVYKFPEGHLVGDLRLINSQLEFGKSTFTFNAEFGGDLGKDFVYLDFEVLNSSASSIGRVCFDVSMYLPQGKWELVFSSERSGRLACGASHRFDIVKFLKAQLMEDRKYCPLKIKWYVGKQTTRRMCASLLTVIPELLQHSSGDVLPLQECTTGLMRVENVEKNTENGMKIYLGLCFVYGAPMPEPDRTQANAALNAAMATPLRGVLELDSSNSQELETEEPPSNDSS